MTPCSAPVSRPVARSGSEISGLASTGESVLVGADHDNRAFRRGYAMLANRADQHADEPAMPAPADHEQVGAA